MIETIKDDEKKKGSRCKKRIFCVLFLKLVIEKKLEIELARILIK